MGRQLEPTISSSSPVRGPDRAGLLRSLVAVWDAFLIILSGSPGGPSNTAHR